MRLAATKIARFTAGRSFEEYGQDEQLQWSVERGFEIIGEALSKLSKADPDTATRITEWRQIISFRNVLIHGYATVSHRTTWDVVQSELPALLAEVEAMLAQ